MNSGHWRVSFAAACPACAYVMFVNCSRSVKSCAGRRVRFFDSLITNQGPHRRPITQKQEESRGRSDAVPDLSRHSACRGSMISLSVPVRLVHKSPVESLAHCARRNDAAGAVASAARADNGVGAWAPPASWPLIAIHTVLTPDGRVLTYGTTDTGQQTGSTIYDIWDPSAGHGRGPHDAAEHDRHRHLLQLDARAATERQCLHRWRRQLRQRRHHQHRQQQQQRLHARARTSWRAATT